MKSCLYYGIIVCFCILKMSLVWLFSWHDFKDIGDTPWLCRERHYGTCGIDDTFFVYGFYFFDKGWFLYSYRVPDDGFREERPSQIPCVWECIIPQNREKCHYICDLFRWDRACSYRNEVRDVYLSCHENSQTPFSKSHLHVLCSPFGSLSFSIQYCMLLYYGIIDEVFIDENVWFWYNE